jgi:biotin-dependent carboxylase-like uncharacterized protein
VECFKVINPGLFTTIQDMGRFGYESQGVPTAGAMDEFSFRVANILAGNDESAPALEITVMGPTLEVMEDVTVAVAGAEMPPLVNGSPRACWSSFPVRKGDVLSFGAIKSGCRAYLAVSGGFQADVIMGSASTYIRGGIGGVRGRRIEKGDILSSKDAGSISIFRKVLDEFIPSYSDEAEIRVIPGPQGDHFTEEALKLFFSSTYTITKDSDRMGYRLEGPEIRAIEKHDIITDGLLPGAVQIPGNGKPIIMMKDAQTTGGYTKIATVISADLALLAQLKPGDRLRFKAVDISEAHRILMESEHKIKKIRETLKPLRYFDVNVNGRSYDVSVETL